MTPENCEDFKELLAANALTALDAEDGRALETHLRSCADCRAEMNTWEETAAFLALDATPLEPSPERRERILASVRAEGRNPELTRADPYAASVGDSSVLAFERPTHNVWTPLGSFGAIAAVLVLAALIISLVVLWQQNRATQAELARLSAELQQTKAQLDHQTAMVQLFTAPDARMAKLAGTDVAPDAHAMLAYDKDGHAMLMAKGLPAAPAGMAYQLWFIVGNKPMPGKLFKTERSGEGVLQDDVPAEALKSVVFAITIEPESGVKVPTGAIYLRSVS